MSSVGQKQPPAPWKLLGILAICLAVPMIVALAFLGVFKGVVKRPAVAPTARGDESMTRAAVVVRLHDAGQSYWRATTTLARQEGLRAFDAEARKLKGHKISWQLLIDDVTAEGVVFRHLTYPKDESPIVRIVARAENGAAFPDPEKVCSKSRVLDPVTVEGIIQEVIASTETNPPELVAYLNLTATRLRR